jgi:membrane associated rhomboid family serine protease
MPLVTYTIIALCGLIYLVDREGRLFGPNVVFADLTMRPSAVLNVASTGDLFPLVTIFTSMFMHANLMHILGNLLFLGVFGPAVEQALGSGRFALYYILWGVAAAGAQIWAGPTGAPTLGASGAIGGVMGAYLLLFPSNKIELTIPLLLFTAFVLPAWILLGAWFAFQILMPQEGVANWAHAGGFLAGMLTVMILGGRNRVLKGRDPDLDFA